jgi:hypothetical protein
LTEYVAASAISEKYRDSWSITAGAQAIIVEIPGVILIDDPVVVYPAVYWLQPEEPVTVPSALKRAVIGWSPITLDIPPFPSVYENSRQFTPVGNEDEAGADVDDGATTGASVGPAVAVGPGIPGWLVQPARKMVSISMAPTSARIFFIYKRDLFLL